MCGRLNRKSRIMILGVAFLFLLFIGMEAAAFARVGGGRSLGGRGYSPRGGRIYQRTTPVQKPNVNQQRPQQTEPQSAPPIQQPQPSFGRSLLYGIGGGLMGGMIGNMLFGGRGYAGEREWSGEGFSFGDIIIILIILGMIYFFYKKYRSRKDEMRMSTVGAGYAPSYAYDEPFSVSAPGSAYPHGDILSVGLRHISEMDPSFSEDKFKETAEDNFFKIQSAWTKRDMGPVRSLLAAHMLDAFQKDINIHISGRKINRLENIAVRKVEIVDAVQDQGEEYITVKFLASLLDYTVHETHGKVISGSSTDPIKFLEYWTFTRKTGERTWRLTGITQEQDY